MNTSLSHLKPYESIFEYMNDAYRLLDMRLYQSYRSMSGESAQDISNPFKGYVMTEEQMEQLFHTATATPTIGGGHAQDEEEAGFLELESALTYRAQLSEQQGLLLPLPYLARQFHLGRLEISCLLLALSVEWDRKYEKMFGYLHDDLTRKLPSVDLFLKLFVPSPQERMNARSLFAPWQPLRKYFLADYEEQFSTGSLLTDPLKLDKRIVHFLLDNDEHAHSLDYSIMLHDQTQSPEPLYSDTEIQHHLRQYLQRYVGRESALPYKQPIIVLHGSSGSGKKLQVRHCCQYLNKPLLIADLRKMTEKGKDWIAHCRHVVRESILREAVLAFEHAECLLEEENGANSADILKELQPSACPIFLLSSKRLPLDGLSEQFVFDVELAIPDEQEREQIWRKFAETYEISDDVRWDVMAGKFRFTPGQMKNALSMAGSLAIWNGRGEEGQVNDDLLHDGCLRQCRHGLEKKGVRIIPRSDWDHLVLPQEQTEQLRQACFHMKYRSLVYGQWGFGARLSYGRGLSLLFAGPPGTGKTMSAEVIAKELKLELYKIDMSKVLSKYIGESEKNLQEIFEEAAFSHAILFFDECDALFGKRSEVKDANDRYANAETAFLLQKMEEYEGVTVLATNLLQNIDEAFMRRITYVVKYPFPDAEHREQLWRSILPPQVPLADDVDLRYLSRKLEVAGGNIKNIALSASFMAADQGKPVSMFHLFHAARHELRKTGKILLKDEFSDYLN